MAVIRQFPDNSGCAVCNSLVDLPHEDLSDCRNALAREMDAILKRAKAITQTRRSLTEQRLRQLDDKMAQPRAKSRRKPQTRRSR